MRQTSVKRNVMRFFAVSAVIGFVAALLGIVVPGIQPVHAQNGSAPGQVRTEPGAFGFASADGHHSVRLGLMAQVAHQRWMGDVPPLAQNTFYLRRVRLSPRLQVYRVLGLQLTADFQSQARTQVLDLVATLNLRPWLRLSAGRFKVPFGQELRQSSADLRFLERSIATGLTPNRDIGVMWEGALEDDLLNWSLGLFNGVADGESRDIDADNTPAVAVRVATRPFGTEGPILGRGLVIGGALTWEQDQERPAEPRLPGLRTTGRQTWFRFASDNERGRILADGPHLRWTVHGVWLAGPFALTGEYIESRLRIRNAAETLDARMRGWHVSTSWTFGGDAAQDGVTPTRPVIFDGWAPGAFEAKARVARVTPDRQIDARGWTERPEAADQATAVGAGLTWWANDVMRVGVDYEWTFFDDADGLLILADEHLLLSSLQLAL